MNTCEITNTNTGKTVRADILKRTDKSMRVVLQGTTTPVNLSRTDVRRPYVGNLMGMELTTRG